MYRVTSLFVMEKKKKSLLSFFHLHLPETASFFFFFLHNHTLKLKLMKYFFRYGSRRFYSQHSFAEVFFFLLFINLFIDLKFHFFFKLINLNLRT